MSAPDLTSRLVAYRDQLGNAESRALIADVLDARLSEQLRASVLLEAAKALIDRDCSYEGRKLVIPCDSHAAAIRLANNLRDAIAMAEAVQ